MNIMIKQRSEEWFKQRVGRITGSRVGAILGMNPWKTAGDTMREMVREHHGAESEFTGNIATEYGTKFEEYAIADLEMEYGIEVQETGFHIKSGADWLGASPDGLVNDDAAAEIKCPFGAKDTGIFKSIFEQPHYHAQTQIEMYCTERTKCYFYQWSQKATKLEIVDYSQAWIDENLPKLKAFHEQYLKEIKTPEKHLMDLVKTREAVELARSYNETKQEIAELVEKQNELKSKLIQIADGKKSNISGILVYESERKGSVDYKKIPELKGVDLEPFRKKSTTFWTVK